MKLRDIVHILAEIYPDFPTDATSSRRGSVSALEMCARQIEFLALKLEEVTCYKSNEDNL